MINSNNIIKALILGLLVMITYSCEDPDEKPILTFDDAGKGSYPRVTSETGSALVNPNDLPSSSYAYSVEFVDETKGADVIEYKFTMSYNGGTEVDMTDRTYTQADFTKNADGFMSMDIPAFTAAELAGLAGGVNITPANADAGDYFIVHSYITKGGRVFGNTNKSSTITGPAFAGKFDTNFPVACPSDMYLGEITYSSDLYQTANGFDGAPTATGVTSPAVSIEEVSAGVFTFTDWSFGGYFELYGGGAPLGDFGFSDLCGVVTFTKSATDSYGDVWSLKFFMAEDKVTLTVAAVNAPWNENALTTVTFPEAQTWTCGNCEDSVDDVTF